MKRAAFVLLLAFAGCSNEEIAPPPSQVMSSPELSHPREPRLTAEPPPPMHEELQRTQINLITHDTAPVQTKSETPTDPATTGTVNALQPADEAPRPIR